MDSHNVFFLFPFQNYCRLESQYTAIEKYGLEAILFSIMHCRLCS